MKNAGTPRTLALTLLLASAASGHAQDRTLRSDESCSGRAAATVVTFADPRLERAVRAALPTGSDGDPTCGLLASLTSLSATGAGIESLEGIQNLTGLTDLELGDNSIRDLRPLAGLTRLTTLGLFGNAIADVSPLAGLTNLADLRLQQNSDLSDIRPLLDNPGLGEGDRLGIGATAVLCTDLPLLAEKLLTVDAIETAEVQCVPDRPLADGPWVFPTYEHARARAVVVTRGLSHPWGMAFLPDGSVLVTERPGRLRLIRDGVLDPRPIPGTPQVLEGRVVGLLDVALHPAFEQNGLVYLTYSKQLPDGPTIALARGRFDGVALRDTEDVFVAKRWGRSVAYAGSRIAFAPDGTLYMTVGGAFGGSRGLAQDPSAHVGKVLRLNDDGSVPADNPFVGRPGYAPEIFSLGHRNQQGAAVHPETGMLWTSEHAPQGGDEVNVIVAGANYGWPEVSFAREYTGPRVAAEPWRPEYEQAAIAWLPSIAVTGMTFYTGTRFPAWKGNLFIGGLMSGRIRGTGHVERIALTEAGEELRREVFLAELRQRIRDVEEGPDGLVYALTDEAEGALIRIEPVDD